MSDEDDVRFDYDAFRASLDRVRSGKDKTDAPVRPGFDPKLAKDVHDDARQGRKIEDYKQALDYLGWKFCTVAELGPVMFGERGPVMRTEGEWRNLRHAAKYPDIRSAFTSNQICEMFPDGPKQFFEWYSERFERARAKAAGLIIPRGIVLA